MRTFYIQERNELAYNGNYPQGVNDSSFYFNELEEEQENKPNFETVNISVDGLDYSVEFEAYEATGVYVGSVLISENWDESKFIKFEDLAIEHWREINENS